MKCKNEKCEVVKSSAAGEEFWYCRTCKDEVTQTHQELVYSKVKDLDIRKGLAIANNFYVTPQQFNELVEIAKEEKETYELDVKLLEDQNVGLYRKMLEVVEAIEHDGPVMCRGYQVENIRLNNSREDNQITLEYTQGYVCHAILLNRVI